MSKSATGNGPTPLTADQADWMLRMLLTIRLFEEKMLDFLATGVIKGGSHIYIGQEAVATGVCAALEPDDYLTSPHRGHGHGLAKGGEPKLLMAEILGRATGVCRGRGGSLHLADMNTGNLGANGIVGGSIGIACGAGLSAKMRGSKQVVACFFGDGAASTGIFHESLNMAQTWGLPVLFVCEDNGYAVHTPVEQRHGYRSITDIVAQFDCQVFQSDSTDVEVIHALTLDARAAMDRDDCPGFMHLRYYRYLEHVGVSEDFDAGYRSREEFDKWLAADPIKVQRERLLGMMPEEQIRQIEEAIEQQVERSRKRAQAAPFPERHVLNEDLLG